MVAAVGKVEPGAVHAALDEGDDQLLAVGDYNPTIKLCAAICRRLGKTLDELFWED